MAITHSRIHKSATRICALLIFGLFIDYGGGLGVKSVVGLIAIGWVVLHRSSIRVLNWRRVDLIFFLITPGFLGLLHLGSTLFKSVGLFTYSLQFYHTISSFLLILMLPIFYYTGTYAVTRQILIGFRLVSVILLIIFLLHVTGIVNLNDYAEIARTYQIGYIGLDSRLADYEASQRPVLSPRIAFVMPFAFALELSVSAIWALSMVLSLLVVGSRGLLIGIFLIFAIWILMSVRNRRLIFILSSRILPLAVLMVLVILLFEPIRFRLMSVLAERFSQLSQGSDLSTQTRIGHIVGYWNMVQENPWTLFIGAGPSGYFINPVLGTQIVATEMSILNLTLWWGMPYALFYTFWLYRAAWRLWTLRKTPGFGKTDQAMVFGSCVFWLTGNFNPMMVSPFATIVYMLLIVRVAELRNLRQGNTTS